MWKMRSKSTEIWKQFKNPKNEIVGNAETISMNPDITIDEKESTHIITS